MVVIIFILIYRHNSWSSEHINTFLKPLVDDLLNLWNGIPLNNCEGTPTMRAALLAVTADLPALRKITQFLGHKADLGCSRCKFQAQREPGTVGASGTYRKSVHACTTYIDISTGLTSAWKT